MSVYECLSSGTLTHWTASDVKVAAIVAAAVAANEDAAAAGAVAPGTVPTAPAAAQGVTRQVTSNFLQRHPCTVRYNI